MDECFTLKQENLVNKATIYSKLCFLWLRDCCKKANKKQLELKDIYRGPESFNSHECGNYLGMYWNEEIKDFGKETHPSLLRAILKAYYLEYCFYGLGVFTCHVVIKSLVPIALSNLIRFFTSKNYTSYDLTLNAVGLCSLITLSSFLAHHTVCGTYLLAMKIRIALSSLIYRKLLKLSQQSLTTAAAGQIVNLLSNDVARLDMAVNSFHFLWITPLQLIAIMGVLWFQFGTSAVFGVVCMILVIVPFEGVLGHFAGLYRTKASKTTDTRIKIMNEIISGIQVIKMYAWEKPFERFVQTSRKDEMKYIKRASYIRGIVASMTVLTERIGLSVTVVCYSLLGYPVKTDVVFALSISFRFLQYSLGSMLPTAVTLGSELLVSLKRIEVFLLMEEKLNSVENYCLDTPYSSVFLNNICATWNDKIPTLNSISISISPGILCAVVGPVGSGKSSLLKLLMGELPRISGDFQARGIISFSSQKPWLFPSTIRRNIVFNEEYEESRYHNVVRICGLVPDLEQLPNYDKTVVGNRGICLSGGQRARINLARAVYRNADIYLLDDILSALDTKVGNYVFEECILKFLSNKTRILVTHQLQYLRRADKIIVLNKGYVEGQGTFEELSKNELDFSKLISVQGEGIEEGREGKRSTHDKEKFKITEDSEQNVDKNSKMHMDQVDEYKKSVFWQYISSSGNICHIFSLICLLIICQMLMNISDYWITLWSEQEEFRHTSTIILVEHVDECNFTVNSFKLDYLFFSEWSDKVQIDSKCYILPKISVMRVTYIIIIVICVTLTVLRSIFFFYLCTRTSQNIHDKMFNCLLRAPIQFFSSNPAGNMLNRFSKDMGATDELLPRALINLLGTSLVLIGSMLLIIISNWKLILLMIPFCIVIFNMRKWFIITVRSLRRIETAAKSPVFSYLSSTIDGVTTIRAARSENQLISQFDRYQDVHTAASFLAITCSSAFGLWLDLLCILFLCSVVVALIIMDNYFNMSGSFIGLAIFQSMGAVGLLQFCIRALSETVNHLTSVERILEYTQLETEDAEKFGITTLPNPWPSEGNIQIKNLYLRYDVDEKPVLQDLSLDISASEKIGVVGRTGAGKSSIITALFRLVPTEGQILIDDVDIKTMNLSQLRQKISIIPQEPILFSASLRYNLDPFYEYPDERIWKVLQEVDLGKSVQSLDFKVTEGGNNFSVGQGQLICLARAILRNNKILVLDEATANVDIRTDKLIQKTILRKFNGCTVFTIAHRLNSVISCDKVLVMDAGRKVEFDHPHILLQNPNGYFYRLVDETGSGMSEILRNMALFSYVKKFGDQCLDH